jgi:ubiquinone biosynthesis protein UbiJ
MKPPVESLREMLARAVNNALALDPDFPPTLAALEGRSIEVEVLGLDFHIHLGINEGRLVFPSPPPENPDVTIRGAPLALMKLFKTDDPTAILQSGEVEMRGDARLGRKFKTMMNALDIDWEELLAQRIGDMPAHYLGTLARGFWGWRRRSHLSAAVSIAEYLQEEIHHLPPRIEVENFLNDVDMLREAVDRAEARIRNLEMARQFKSDKTKS